jgi:methionine sulfoxide reductase heme-binding subunit
MSSYSDPGQHIFWIASRGLGVVALVLVSISVGIGLALSARVARGPGVAGGLKHAHEAISLVSVGAIGAHGLVLMGDSYLRPGLSGIALPFAMAHQPFWTGIGIIGGWLAAIMAASFYVRRWIGTRAWRWLHRWTLAVYVLAVLHTLGSGSDARSAWLLAILGLTATPIVLLGTYRFLPRPRARRARPGAERPQQGRPRRAGALS